MKKVVSIVAVVALAIGMFATQAEKIIDLDFSIENMIACNDCERGDMDRAGRGDYDA